MARGGHGPASSPRRALGLDFGTTNTVLAWAGAGASAIPIAFDAPGGPQVPFRSALCWWNEGDDDHPRVAGDAGPWALERFMEHAGDCRFIQSLKTFAASRLFEQTYVYGSAFRFEHLFSAFFRMLRGHAGPALEALPRELVVGRPVEYAGSRPDAALAMQRYRDALAPFGFERIHPVYEPVAAAFFYAQSLERGATVLVADFGGGTTDFSIVRFERDARGLRAKALAHSGVGVAGDRFDYRLIERVVLPELGLGTTYRSMGKRLEMPRSCFASFASWHELSVMKGSRDFRDFREVARFSDAPEVVARFVGLVDSDRGYALYRAVSATKEALSAAESAPFRFEGPGFEIRATVTRAQFEAWIAPELEAIEAALEAVLARSGLAPREVDRVFLTGGSSFVPAVRRMFDARFGAASVSSGDEFVSIASGLATIGLREDLDDWVVRG